MSTDAQHQINCSINDDETSPTKAPVWIGKTWSHGPKPGSYEHPSNLRMVAYPIYDYYSSTTTTSTSMEDHHEELAKRLDQEGLMGTNTPVACTITSINQLVELDEGRFANTMEESMKLFQKRLAMETELFGQDNHPIIGYTHHNIGLILFCQGKYDQAMDQYQIALGIDTKAHGPEHSLTATTHGAMGDVWYIKGNLENAMKCCQRALDIRLKVHGRDHPSIGVSHFAMGNVLYRRGLCSNRDNPCYYEQAMEHYLAALEIGRNMFAAFGPEDPSWTGATLHAMGNLVKEQKKYQQALDLYQMALSFQSKAHGPEHSSIGDTHQAMGDVVLERQSTRMQPWNTIKRRLKSS